MVKRTRGITAPPSPPAPARPELDTEFANRLSDPFETAYMGVLRTNDPLLMERGNGGVQIYWDLKRDGKVFDGLQKRQLALIGKAWQVEPVKADSAKGTADAETLTGILKACNFDKLCSELLEALLAGYAVSEIVWTTRDGMWVPARVVQRAQRRFVYVQQDENSAPWLHLLTRENMLTGTPVPPRKFIVHRVNAEDDNPYGLGLGLQLYWPVYFKRKGVLAWTKFLDRFGLPIPWGKYPASASPREKGTLFDALRAVSNDGMIMTPEGTMIELLESKLSGSATPHQAHVEFMDDWIMEVILGQSPRGKSGGAMAAASNEREDVRLELSQADSDLLSETLNSTLIQWICELNGLEPCLVYRKVEKEEDTKAESETDKNISELGFQMTEEGAKAKYGEHWERKAAPTPTPLPTAQLPVVNNANPADFAEGDAAAPDAIDRLVNAELSQWRQAMEPMTAPLQALLEQAAAEGLTARQLLDRLPKALDDAHTLELTQALTRTAFAARVGAASGVENG